MMCYDQGFGAHMCRSSSSKLDCQQGKCSSAWPDTDVDVCDTLKFINVANFGAPLYWFFKHNNVAHINSMGRRAETLIPLLSNSEAQKGIKLDFYFIGTCKYAMHLNTW